MELASELRHPQMRIKIELPVIMPHQSVKSMGISKRGGRFGYVKVGDNYNGKVHDHLRWANSPD